MVTIGNRAIISLGVARENHAWSTPTTTVACVESSAIRPMGKAVNEIPRTTVIIVKDAKRAPSVGQVVVPSPSCQLGVVPRAIARRVRASDAHKELPA